MTSVKSERFINRNDSLLYVTVGTLRQCIPYLKCNSIQPMTLSLASKAEASSCQIWSKQGTDKLVN